jgi:hypothetical protein
MAQGGEALAQGVADDAGSENADLHRFAPFAAARGPAPAATRSNRLPGRYPARLGASRRAVRLAGLGPCRAPAGGAQRAMRAAWSSTLRS